MNVYVYKKGWWLKYDMNNNVSYFPGYAYIPLE